MSERTIERMNESTMDECRKEGINEPANE